VIASTINRITNIFFVVSLSVETVDDTCTPIVRALNLFIHRDRKKTAPLNMSK